VVFSSIALLYNIFPLSFCYVIYLNFHLISLQLYLTASVAVPSHPHSISESIDCKFLTISRTGNSAYPRSLKVVLISSFPS
jgi:hypothetical protein